MKQAGLGILLGIALTLVLLELWGRRIGQTEYDNAQPHLMRPLQGVSAPTNRGRDSTDIWFPGGSAERHDGWTIRGFDGSAAKLGDFRGNVVFLNFWSTTCAPCLEELPSIEKVRNSMQGQPIKFLLVTQEDQRTVKEFIAKRPIAAATVFVSSEPPVDLPFNGYPTTFILDRSGVAVFKHSGFADWSTEGTLTYLERLAH